MNSLTPLVKDANLDQIGIVVHDAVKFSEELTRLFGIGPFRVMEWPVEGVEPEATYHGEPGSYKLLLAFASFGSIQIEIVQPLEGQNIYSDFLRDHGPGLHHFRLTTADYDEAIKALTDEGIKNIASGTGVHVGSRWTYFDTTSILEGVTVEIRKRLDGAGGQGQWVDSSHSTEDK